MQVSIVHPRKVHNAITILCCITEHNTRDKIAPQTLQSPAYFRTFKTSSYFVNK